MFHVLVVGGVALAAPGAAAVGCGSASHSGGGSSGAHDSGFPHEGADAAGSLPDQVSGGDTSRNADSTFFPDQVNGTDTNPPADALPDQVTDTLGSEAGGHAADAGEDEQ